MFIHCRPIHILIYTIYPFIIYTKYRSFIISCHITIHCILNRIENYAGGMTNLVFYHKINLSPNQTYLISS